MTKAIVSAAVLVLASASAMATNCSSAATAAALNAADKISFAQTRAEGVTQFASDIYRVDVVGFTDEYNVDVTVDASCRIINLSVNEVDSSN